MNPGEQNGEQDILNFLHSEHDTFFEYNQEKLGSDIHASVSSMFWISKIFWGFHGEL